MNTLFNLKNSLIVTAMLVLPMAHASAMTKADYQSSKARISAEYKTDKAACAALADNAKDVCHEEAKAKEKVALAELEFAHTNKMSDQNRLLVVKAETAYAVAKEKCDDKAGNAKDVCVQEAKAIETKALADAKMGKKIIDAGNDAAKDKHEADYKLAAEKCDVLAGDAKTSCIAAAKAKFGQK
ncbi:MAG: hypothetical protein V4532_11615 [Pseudomonadota bacterium]